MCLHRIRVVALGALLLSCAVTGHALPNVPAHSRESLEMMGVKWSSWLQRQERLGYGLVECTYNSIVSDGVPWSILDVFRKGGQKSWLELNFTELGPADIEKGRSALTTTIDLSDDHMDDAVRQMRAIFGEKLGKLSDSDIRYRLYNAKRSVCQFTSGKVSVKGALPLADLARRGPLQTLTECFSSLSPEDVIKNQDKLFALIDTESPIDGNTINKITSSLELSHPISSADLVKDLERTQKCLLNFNGYSKDGLIQQLHTIIDSDCKTWVAKEFSDIERSSIVATKHRLVGHKPLDMKITMDDVTAFKNAYYPDGYPTGVDDRLVMRRLEKIRRIMLDDMTTRVQKVLGVPKREARAFALLFGSDNHILADMLEGENSPKYSAQVADSDVVCGNIKEQVRILAKDKATAKMICDQIDDASRAAKRVGGGNRQATATALSKKLKKIDFGAIQKPYVDEALRKNVATYNRANAQIKLASGRARYLLAQAGKSSLRWGGIGGGDVVGTLAMLYFTGELNRREMVKHGVSIAIAGGLAVGTEVALAAAGLSAATLGSSGIISWAVNILAPVPIGGGAIMVAGGIYLGTRWAVCTAFDAYEQQQVERIEAEAAQYERRFRIQKLTDLSEENTKMLRRLAIGGALGEGRD